MSVQPPQIKQPTAAPLHGPWPSTSTWARRWPGPGRTASSATVAAVGAAALVAALSLQLGRPGIGWLITAVAGAIALTVAGMIRETPPGPAPLVVRPAVRLGWDRLGWGAATVALFGVGTFRAAGWLFVLCVLVAALTFALAVAGGRSLRSIVAAGTMPPIAAFRSIRWMSRGLARVRVGGDGGPAGHVRIVATVAVSLVLLTVFGALFASADPAFAGALSTAIPDINIGTGFRCAFLFALTAAVLGGAAYLRAAPPDLSGLDTPASFRANRYEWAIPLGLLVALFAAFVGVQLSTLYGGNRHVLDTDGLTYADYARGGFWQLSFVTGLTLMVLAGAARWAPRKKTADRLLIRVILGALTLLTLAIVGSALHRMNLYADTYGLTRLRLLVACCEGWFGLVLVFVLIAGVRIRAPWLPRVAIAAGVLALLGLAVANPDNLIAERNLKQSHSIDYLYLSTLSPDAVPALTGLASAQRLCVLDQIHRDLENAPDDWRGWNLGRERARRLTAGLSDDGYLPCNLYGD